MVYMKRFLSLSAIALLSAACCGGSGDQPLTGGQWGEIRNASAEEVISDQVSYWTPRESRFQNAVCFYDSEAREGTKSLCISSPGYAVGSWTNKVNLLPWSRYRFSGWIKTDGVRSGKSESGAYFSFSDLAENDQVPVIRGTQDWTLVQFEFETGENDGSILNCCYGSAADPVQGKAWFDDMSLELLSSEKYTTSIEVRPSQIAGEPMSDYIYGQFIEHLGRCIYGGIWAEMVTDRKFWYSPSDRESVWKVLPAGMSGMPQGIQAFMALRNFQGHLQMDTSAPFTGAHTPVLVSDEASQVALVQNGMGLNAGVGAVGHIVLKSDCGMPVTVELSASGQTQKVEFNTTGSYAEYPLSFAGFASKEQDVTIRIIPGAAGRLWVGTVSLMPEDNVDGFRPDVLELLRGLNSPVYRWPGGNFVSGYDWKDGIGPRDSRPPRKNPAWSGVESNDVGLHEFMHLCELIGTEPYVAVNAGLGGVKAAAEEVQYCNGDASTPMGRLRASNGSADPWGVKWWSVGNEMYGDWQLGHMSTEAFVEKHNSFAKAMKAESSDIHLIAVGSVGPWDEMIMSQCNEHMELISEHLYCQDYKGTGLMTHALQIPRAIRSIADAHRHYRETIPSLDGKDIRICLDEWNFWYGPHIYGELGTRYYLRDALGIAAGLNEYMRNSDIIFMANYAQTVNVIGAIKSTTTDACYAATGEVLRCYREHFGMVPVNITGEFRPFDVVASLNPDTDEVTVSVVNLTYEERPLNLSFPDSDVCTDGGRVYTVSGSDDMVYNTPGQEPSVKTVEREVKSLKSEKVAPYSANIYVFKLK